MKTYSSSFYDHQQDVSYRSACAIIPYVFSIYNPRSIIDFGCGVGTWLAAAKKEGIDRLVGLEGKWVQKDSLADPTIKLINTELESNVSLKEKFDLAISMEVAEHLSPERGSSFVKDLTKHAPVVLFSAAIPGQRGIHHINERKQDYWVNEFRKHGFECFDVVRAKFWNDSSIGPAYRQNCFLFAKPEVKLNINQEFLLPDSMVNLVHPVVFDRELDREPALLETIKNIVNLPRVMLRKIRR